MARAHSLLAASRWDGVQLGQLIDEELAIFGRDGAARLAATGPAVMLKPSAAQSLALVLHELATNAIKYGALSNPAGRLAIDWRETAGADGQPQLHLCWTETGGPEVEPPSHRGFGSRVIGDSFERQLGGRLLLDWRRTGLVCNVTLPLEGLAEDAISRQPPAPPVAAAPAPASSAGHGRDLAGQSVLIVEDEPLIALQLGEVLADEGARVVGPAGSVAAALALVSPGLGIALLDVNLGGERSFAVADALARFGVPFVFLTGYGPDVDLPERFAGATALEKPIDIEGLLAALRQMLGAAAV